MKRVFYFLILIITISQSFAQNYSVLGTVVDKNTNSPLIGANVLLINPNDTTRKKGIITDNAGKFVISGLTSNKYIIRITYIGYKTYNQNITFDSRINDLAVIALTESVKHLKSVDVVAKQVGVQQVGDTTQYKASTYKVNPDATADQLVTKMPGITSEQGTVKSNGENIQQVLVNNKPFFGDDPNVALKNFPAEVIDKIQVFDKLSDQAQLTGFDDGNSIKTMNIITRTPMNNSQFGKIFAGYGTDDRYIAGGNINYFKGDERISVIGLFNNVNQQNFSTQDLLGVMGSSSSRRGGFAGQRFLGDRGSGGSGGGAPGGFGGGNMNNLLVGQQNGIVTTNAVGVNYTDKWGSKVSVTGSYFFNMTDNKNNYNLIQNYYDSINNGLVYKENNLQEVKNINHRFNLRFECTIDTLNSLIFTPRYSIQDNNQWNTTSGENINSVDALLSQMNTGTHSQYTGYSLNNSLLFRHKFQKKGRTVSLNISSAFNNKTGSSSQNSITEYYQPIDTVIINQVGDLNSWNYSYSASLNYTEPIGAKGQLQLNYYPSYGHSNSDKRTLNFNAADQTYNLTNPTLSSIYHNINQTQGAGITYKFNGSNYFLSAGLNYQKDKLDGDQIYPYSYKTEKSFNSLLPNFSYNYKNKTGESIRIFYRTSTVSPTTSQLQNVIDNSNTLSLSTGNPNLRQEYMQNFTTRYSLTNSEKATSFFAFLSAQYTQDYIANNTFIANNNSNDTINGIVLYKGSGSQFTRPVNMNDYMNFRSFLTYGLPLSSVKCNLNLNAGYSYSSTPGIINNRNNRSVNSTSNLGIVIGSNISEKVDFTVSYFAYYNTVSNNLQEALNSHYYYHTVTGRFNLIFWNGFVLGSDMTQTYYTALKSGSLQNFILWNMSLARKFLPGQNAELKISAFDILNQNKSFQRSVTVDYIEDLNTNVLKQYVMLTFTYNLKKFK
ncbi:MAG: TonB-dependent receptor [Bacteroidia bacterium]|nr:TonB-dependent receptor [Bacteroidia bacterium]